MNRRHFIRYTSIAGAGVLAMGVLPLQAFSSNKLQKITILHTNDVHSRIDPFPMDGSRNQGLGGFARRAKLIADIRNQEKHLLLFDAGDILQGTPYFNFYQGELEFKLMSEMGYHASTIGNHDFDAGIERLAELANLAEFSLICSNYNFRNTPLAEKTINNKVYSLGHIRVGVYGLGIELDGLVPAKLYGNTVYNDPLQVALEQEEMLKTKMGCDLIICLSHLGFDYESNKISDIIIGKNTRFTDLIIGGHTHTFLSKPEIVQNIQNKECRIFQVGWGGINLGRLDFFFNPKKEVEIAVANSFSIS